MNEMQSARHNQLIRAKTKVYRLERELFEARSHQHACKEKLEAAIEADPTSWHNTPGILK